jgi:hypothetical protein
MKTGAFSNWHEIKTDARKRTFNKATGQYSWQIEDVTDILTGKNWTANVLQKKSFLNSPDVDAYTVCSLVTAVSTLPVLLVLIGILVAATSFVSYILSLMPHFAILLWQILVRCT